MPRLHVRCRARSRRSLLFVPTESGLVLQEPPVSFAQPFLQADPCAPADLCQTRHIEQLSRGSVGLAGIEGQAPLEADYPCNGFGELADRAVKANADIDVREHGFDMRLPDISRQVQHVRKSVV